MPSRHGVGETSETLKLLKPCTSETSETLKLRNLATLKPFCLADATVPILRCF